MKQYNYIYKITNLANGKIYIGKHSTDNLNDSYMGSGKIIKNARAKYGKDSFKKDIIAFTDNEDSLNFLEKFYIKKYKSQDSSIGYNISSGGQGSANVNKGKPSWNKGGTITDEQKKKISEALKGKHRTIEARKKMSIAHKGKPSCMKGKTQSDDARKKMSAAHKGKTTWMKGKHHSDEVRKKISIAHKGKTASDETRKKMSAVHKGNKYMLGKHHSDETRKKLSATFSGEKNPFYGKKHTDETKAKLKIKYKWMTPDGDIKIMGKGNANYWHPDWKLIEK